VPHTSEKKPKLTPPTEYAPLALRVGLQVLPQAVSQRLENPSNTPPGLTARRRLYQYGEEDEYDIEDLREAYFLLDWLSCQFCFQRPLKKKNLVLYGLPKTTKFKIHMLSSVLRIFFAGPRGQAFSGADDYFDLWIFDLTKGDHDADDPFCRASIASLISKEKNSLRKRIRLWCNVI